MTTNDERVRLWVDNLLVIDQWTSLAATEASGTILFGLGNEFYDITLEYAAQARHATHPHLCWRCLGCEPERTRRPIPFGISIRPRRRRRHDVHVGAVQAPGTSDSGLSLKWENGNTQVGAKPHARMGRKHRGRWVGRWVGR